MFLNVNLYGRRRLLPINKKKFKIKYFLFLLLFIDYDVYNANNLSRFNTKTINTSKTYCVKHSFSLPIVSSQNSDLPQTNIMYTTYVYNVFIIAYFLRKILKL